MSYFASMFGFGSAVDETVAKIASEQENTQVPVVDSTSVVAPTLSLSPTLVVPQIDLSDSSPTGSPAGSPAESPAGSPGLQCQPKQESKEDVKEDVKEDKKTEGNAPNTATLAVDGSEKYRKLSKREFEIFEEYKQKIFEASTLIAKESKQLKTVKAKFVDFEKSAELSSVSINFEQKIKGIFKSLYLKHKALVAREKDFSIMFENYSAQTIPQFSVFGVSLTMDRDQFIEHLTNQSIIETSPLSSDKELLGSLIKSYDMLQEYTKTKQLLAKEVKSSRVEILCVGYITLQYSTHDLTSIISYIEKMMGSKIGSIGHDIKLNAKCFVNKFDAYETNLKDFMVELCGSFNDLCQCVDNLKLCTLKEKYTTEDTAEMKSLQDKLIIKMLDLAKTFSKTITVSSGITNTALSFDKRTEYYFNNVAKHIDMLIAYPLTEKEMIELETKLQSMFPEDAKVEEVKEFEDVKIDADFDIKATKAFQKITPSFNKAYPGLDTNCKQLQEFYVKMMYACQNDKLKVYQATLDTLVPLCENLVKLYKISSGLCCDFSILLSTVNQLEKKIICEMKLKNNENKFMNSILEFL